MTGGPLPHLADGRNDPEVPPDAIHTNSTIVRIAAALEAHPLSLHADLIYDLGMHVGQDTEFYLKKGFRVVAVEANPILAELGASRFQSEIDVGTSYRR